MKYLILIASLFIFSGLTAQTLKTTIEVPTISAMKTLVASATRVHVVANNSDYDVCSICTADEITVFAGAAGKKWKLSVPQSVLDSLTSHRTYFDTATSEYPIALKPVLGDTIPVQGNGIRMMRDSIYAAISAIEPGGTVDQTIIDGSTNAVAGNAVNDALALKANLASPTFTGTPTLPSGTIATTQAAGNSTTAVATTAFVTTANNLKANLASPAFTGTPTVPTATAGTNTTQAASTAFVQAAVAASTAGVASFNGRTGTVVPVAGDYAALTETLTNKSISGADNTFSNIPEAAITGLTAALAAKLGGVAAPSGSSTANAASVSGTNLVLHPADATNPGIFTPTMYKQLLSKVTSTWAAGSVSVNLDFAQHDIDITTTGARTLSFGTVLSTRKAVMYLDNTSGATFTLTLPANSFVQNPTTGIYVSTASIEIAQGKTILTLTNYKSAGTSYWFTY